MMIFKTIASLQEFLHKENGSIGFVPTMGALHSGHLSLIERSKEISDLTVCSIFINPSQFNKANDLKNYPVTTERDVKKLTGAGCDLLFLPSVEEMYPGEMTKNFDFGHLSKVMEAEFRPGHFDGVATVIERFFEIINPKFAFFGEKDFQQLAVIKALVEQLNLDVKIIGCPIVREKNGLAMSSRNERLTEKEKNLAANIHKALLLIKKEHQELTVTEAKARFSDYLSKQEGLTIEYIEIADGNNLNTIEDWEETDYSVAFTAVSIRNVRLIDNMTIINP